MLLKTPGQKIFYRLFLALISVVYLFSAPLVPSKETPIEPLRPSEVKLTFAALADPQISNYIVNRVPTFDAACEDLHNAAVPFDALLIAGDVAENGLAIEYQYLYDHLQGLSCRYIIAEGNHDIRLRLYQQSKDRFLRLTNALNGEPITDSYHYSTVVGGYTFIVLGSDSTAFEENDLSDGQLSWLDGELAAQNGRPVFVVCHQPLKNTHGLPDTWGSPFDFAGSVGRQSDRLAEILQKYDNVIFITGHLHTGFGRYTYEKLGNAQLVNLPSVSIKNKDGDVNEGGLGCMVECYEDEIIFRARAFATGEWLPQFDHVIKVK